MTVLLATLGVLVACGTTVSPSATPTDPPQARVTAAGLVFDSADIVEADSAYAAELEASSLFVRGWRTDFSRHTVPLGRYE